MQNKGTDYIRRLLKDKARLKRWRKMILCLSCVVVFCTVYALILPAITLERKTVCGQEEHSHTEECYSSDGQLTCGKTEHIHTESCYADDKTSEDQSGEDPQQTPEQNQTEGLEQNSGQSQEQNQNQNQDQSQSQDQVQTSDDGNVAQNGENGDTAGTTADETSGNDEESVVAGSTSVPAAEGEVTSRLSVYFFPAVKFLRKIDCICVSVFSGAPVTPSGASQRYPLSESSPMPFTTPLKFPSIPFVLSALAPVQKFPLAT